MGEWRQLLSHARGSLFEIEAQLIAASRLGYINEHSISIARAQAKAVGRPLAGLIAYVQRREHRQPATGDRQRR
jgi:four helix bundle protein